MPSIQLKRRSTYRSANAYLPNRDRERVDITSVGSYVFHVMQFWTHISAGFQRSAQNILPQSLTQLCLVGRRLTRHPYQWQ
jgi:hypothetical protein